MRLQILVKRPARAIVVETAAKPARLAHFWQGAYPLRRPHATRLQHPWCFFTILTSKCASCHNCVHFFNISTSKSALRLKRFVHFYFETCFVPQRLGLFQRLTSQKCSEAEVFLKGVHIFDISTSKIEPVMVLTFSVPNVLRPATACAFSTSQLPQVLRG